MLPMAEKNVPYPMDDSDIHAFFEQVDAYGSLALVDSFKRLAVEYKGSYTFQRDKGRIVYLSEDVRTLCDNYQKWLHIRMPVQSDLFFPGKYPQKYIPKTSVDRKIQRVLECDRKIPKLFPNFCFTQ